MELLKYFKVFFLASAWLWLAGCATNGDRPEKGSDTAQTPGAYVDDSIITTKVKTAIFNEPGLDSAEISVETYHGVVQLSGFVESQSDISRAVEVAQRVEGVQSVKNDMRLKSDRPNP
jgi:osmotically-inducible protein OsmY